MKFFSLFLAPEDDLIKVKYFTAPPLSQGKRIRQSALLKANDLINGKQFEIIRGKYIDKTITCNNCRTEFLKPEEKRTDVNIAVNLIGDCALDKVDKIVLVSADSDLVPPLEFIKIHYPKKKIKIYFPPSNYSNDLKNIATRKKVTLLEKNWVHFKEAIMFEIVHNKNQTESATIPSKWKI